MKEEWRLGFEGLRLREEKEEESEEMDMADSKMEMEVPFFEFSVFLPTFLVVVYY